MKVTEGLLSYDEEHVRFQIADQLSDHGYNKGALLAAAHLLTDSRPSILSASGQCGGETSVGGRLAWEGDWCGGGGGDYSVPLIIVMVL